MQVPKDQDALYTRRGHWADRSLQGAWLRELECRNVVSLPPAVCDWPKRLT
jgi:hypothetical protein